MRKSKGEIIFDIFNYALMILLVIITIYPFLYVIFASFSDPAELIKLNGILLRPAGFSLEGYKAVISNKEIFTGYMNTIFYVVVGTSCSVFFTILTAYPLSKKNLKYGRYVMLMILFTMFFSGGMIPSYLTVKNLGLLNTRGAIIIPGLILTYNLIIMRTSFSAIPSAVEESAKIDGANDFTILFRIVVPLSWSVIAVMVLYYGVGQWNAWFNASIYLKDRKLFPLQLFLREILINSSTDKMVQSAGSGSGAKASLEEVLKNALVVVSTVPIMIVYPFLQKHFVKGVMIGAVKG